jgi:transposase-like protein
MVNNITSGWRLIKKACPMSEASASPKAAIFGGYGEIVDVFLQKRRDGAAVKRFFNLLIKLRLQSYELTVSFKI